MHRRSTRNGVVSIITATVLGIGALTGGAQPGHSSSGDDDYAVIHHRDAWPRSTVAILDPGPRSRPPPAMTPTPLAGRHWADDPRVYLLQAAAQSHRSGSLGLLSAVGCVDCPALGAHGMSEARLNHSQ